MLPPIYKVMHTCVKVFLKDLKGSKSGLALAYAHFNFFSLCEPHTISSEILSIYTQIRIIMINTIIVLDCMARSR